MPKKIKVLFEVEAYESWCEEAQNYDYYLSDGKLVLVEHDGCGKYLKGKIAKIVKGKKVQCTHCWGEGEVEGFGGGPWRCRHCNGTGRVTI
jgi:hypothetical protein